MPRPLALHPLTLSLSKGRAPCSPRALNTLRQAQGERSWEAISVRLACLTPFLLLAACAQQAASGVAPATPGFLLGLWHGFIFPAAWVLSLFMDNVAIYAVPNNGGWYDFGYFIGIVFLGVGSRGARTVYVRRRR